MDAFDDQLVSPREIPEIVTDLCDWTASDTGRSYWDWFREEHRADVREHGERPVVIQSCLADATFRARADLYYIAPPMAELARFASTSIPDFLIQPEDLPSPSGFMLCPSALTTLGGPGGARYGLHGFAWDELPAGQPGVLVAFLTNRDEYMAANSHTPEMANTDPDWLRRSLPRWFERTDAGAWFFGERSEGDRNAVGDFPAPALVLKSIWLLMQQTISVVRSTPLDRETRRRLERKRILHTPIRVITLRRAEGQREDSEHGGREYLHQWVVRGHWRQQWYASRGVHRPVLIAPHIKGPEGAPLLGGDKVYAWTR